MDKLDLTIQDMFVFAARYAHNRNKADASLVVRTILCNWGGLSNDIKRQLKKEALEATCNFEDWNRLINKEL